ncbi:MAG: hypothetical protein KGS72_27300 [Cyanobacteria bacterium REEB67]|nr:hypothetical protein [Cyanobacteria bacterium REEB67]
MYKFTAWILLSFLLFIDGTLLGAVAAIPSIATMIIMAPLTLLSLGLGLDMSREICTKIANKWPRIDREAMGTLIMIICLAIMPLPLTLVLASADILFPGHMGTIVSLFEAWRVAAGMTIVVAFLRLGDYPISLRSISRFFAKAYVEEDR